MLSNFKTYQLAVQFHRLCVDLKTPVCLRDQLLRASSSVVLNIAEGSAKLIGPDRHRFYSIALGSLRESTAVLDISNLRSLETANLADQLGPIYIGCVIRKVVRL